jgi:hypothetical protein
MAQQPARFCSECGALLQASQRFCTNCGATMSVDAAAPTMGSSAAILAGEPTVAAVPDLPAGGFNAPAPPPQMGHLTAPPPPPVSGTYNPYTASAPGVQTYGQNASAPGYSPTPGFAPVPSGGTPMPVPAYAQKPKRSNGCLITSILLLVVLAAGIGTFVFFRSRSTPGAQSNGPSTSLRATATAPVTGGGQTPTVGTSGLQPLNLKITYASVAITILSAQIAPSFPDDSSGPGSAGELRVNLQENNTTSDNPGYLESDAVLLVLPDGSTVRTTNQKQTISPDPGVNRANWLDFALTSQVSVSQLMLRMGAATESQMDIPLRTGADLGKYQDKTSSPNAQFVYSAVNWTLKTATLSYSYSDRQATTGNIYVILSLSAINNSSNSFVDSVGSYMRLQVNGASAEPDGRSTIPISIASHTTASGLVAFLMPQGATSFTLVLLGQPNPPVNQVTQNFQIQ